MHIHPPIQFLCVNDRLAPSSVVEPDCRRLKSAFPSSVPMKRRPGRCSAAFFENAPLGIFTVRSSDVMHNDPEFSIVGWSKRHNVKDRDFHAGSSWLC
jgi:hypothetical protein